MAGHVTINKKEKRRKHKTAARFKFLLISSISFVVRAAVFLCLRTAQSHAQVKEALCANSVRVKD